MSASKPGGKSRPQRKILEVDLGFTWGRLNSLMLALGVAVLAVGYVALSKGSITLAPVLLVLGYCGLIPASLLVRGRGHDSGE